MTFGNEKTTVNELNQLKKRLNHTRNTGGLPATIERLEAEISLLEMGITPNTNLEMCS